MRDKFSGCVLPSCLQAIRERYSLMQNIFFYFTLTSYQALRVSFMAFISILFDRCLVQSYYVVFFDFDTLCSFSISLIGTITIVLENCGYFAY